MSIRITGWSVKDSEDALEEFVILRADDPLTNAPLLWKKAVKTVLPLAPCRARMTSQIQEMIKLRWREFENSLAVEVPVIVEKVVEVKMDVESELEKVPVSLLMEITGRKLGNILDSLSVAPRMHKVANQPKPVVKKVRQVRVAIIGFLPKQERDLAGLYQGDFKLKFYDKEKSTSIPCTTDWVICQRHISHKMTEIARKSVGRGRTIFTRRGSVRSALEALDEVVKKELALKES